MTNTGAKVGDVLVTGGTGMIGRSVGKCLLELEARIRIAAALEVVPALRDCLEVETARVFIGSWQSRIG